MVTSAEKGRFEGRCTLLLRCTFGSFASLHAPPTSCLVKDFSLPLLIG